MPHVRLEACIINTDAIESIDFVSGKFKVNLPKASYTLTQDKFEYLISKMGVENYPTQTEQRQYKDSCKWDQEYVHPVEFGKKQGKEYFVYGLENVHSFNRPEELDSPTTVSDLFPGVRLLVYSTDSLGVVGTLNTRLKMELKNNEG